MREIGMSLSNEEGVYYNLSGLLYSWWLFEPEDWLEDADMLYKIAIVSSGVILYSN